MFKKIPQNLSDLSHFLNDKRVQFKEETVGGVDVVVPCYMIADAEFWDLPHARELRGHTYRKDTGELLGAAFHKFFNIGEREETQFHNIDWNECAHYTLDKMDGSMINPVVIKTGHRAAVYFKTKKSFYSDVAIEFTKWFWKQPQAEVWSNGIIELWKQGFSPIFEFYHPDWQVVLNYGAEPKVWLLNTRRWDNGEYYDGITNSPLPGMPRRPVETWDNFSRDIQQLQKTVTGVEGWIVYNYKRNDFYKVKTDWYLQQHRVRTQMRERDVAEMAALEQLDDVKSLVSAAGLDLSKIEVIEKQVSSEIAAIREEVEFQAEQGHKNGFSPKDMALSFVGIMPENFGLIMQKFRGKEPNYADYYLRTCLQKFSLKNVYNEKF